MTLSTYDEKKRACYKANQGIPPSLYPSPVWLLRSFSSLIALLCRPCCLWLAYFLRGCTTFNLLPSLQFSTPNRRARPIPPLNRRSRLFGFITEEEEIQAQDDEREALIDTITYSVPAIIRNSV